MSKIKQEELENIIAQQNSADKLINNLGLLEVKKHELLHAFAQVNAQIEDTKKDLESTYGNVNVNLETGEYTEIKDEQGS
jgi:vacuolar-type H+-ATPase subunit D/Vma8|tara:strand:+ start:757 stop:996 length:240 start_codon:yes stop_codon:yes gene_type:complete